MLESFYRGVNNQIGNFRRNWLNTGYIEHIIKTEQTAEQERLTQLAGVVGRLAANSSYQDKRLADEAELLRDQLFELERGRINIDEDTSEKVSSHQS